MSKNIKVELGGVDCTAYLRKSNIITTYGDSIAKAELEFTKNVDSAVSITNALTVAIYEDSSAPPTTKVFDGFIDLFQPQAGIIRITAKDQLALLINKQVMHYYDKSVFGDPSYSDGKISKIFRDLVETYGGLSTNTGATVQDSGTEITLAQYACRNADVFERCRKLAETLNWVFYYRADTGFVYFEPKNYTVNSTVLTVGSNVVQVPNWEYDRAEMINDLRLEGAQQLVQATQIFTGNASDTVFTLTDIPESLAVYYSAAKNYSTTAKLASEYKIGDVVGSTSTHDYEIDKKNKTITFTSFVPANSANNILAEVSYYAPIPIHMINDVSIATYGTYAKTVTLTDVLGLSDAWKRAENILSKYSAPFKSAKLKVLWTSSLALQVGQSIKVIDNINSPTVSQYFTIYKIIDNWPEATTDIEIGDKQYTIEEYQANLLERVKRLEESFIGTTSAVTEIVQQSIPFDIVPDTTTVELQLINDSFILDHTNNSLIYDSGETALLDDFESAATWTGAGLASIALTDDSTAGHYFVGTQGVKATWTESTGTGTLTKTITSADLQNVVGVASGTPSQGTAGLWIYCADGTKISEVKLRIGNDSSNYKGYIAQTFAQRNSVTGSFSLQNAQNLLLFDLNSPDETAGTTDWTVIDYIQVRFTVTGATNATFDYCDCSKNNNISLNGLGDRATTFSSTVYTW